VAEGGITGKGFVKGDPRINRKGRPRSFDAFRELAQAISHEEAKSGGGKQAEALSQEHGWIWYPDQQTQYAGGKQDG